MMPSLDYEWDPLDEVFYAFAVADPDNILGSGATMEEAAQDALDYLRSQRR